MDLTAHFRRMARNSAWSNYRLLDACSRLSGEDYRASRTSFFPSIQATLDHILLVDLYYLDALEGSPLGRKFFKEWRPVTEFAVLRMNQLATDQRLIGFCDIQTNDSLGRVIGIDRGPEGIWQETIGDTLAHLFVHQIHHRGQVHAMLSGSSSAPPQLDEYFLKFDADRRGPDLATLDMEGPEAIV